MTRIDASRTRIPATLLNKVASKGSRVQISRKRGPAVYLVSEGDVAALEQQEDRLDAAEALEALAKHKASGGQTVPLEKVKQRLGI